MFVTFFTRRGLCVRQHQRGVCRARAAGTAENIAEENAAGKAVPIAGSATLRAGQPALQDARRDVQQCAAAALGLGPDAVPSVSGAGISGWCRGHTVSEIV